MWIESAGLRGVRTAVRLLADQYGLSSRQLHRRIRGVDDKTAQLLRTLQPHRLQDWAQPQNRGLGSVTLTELVEAARADTYTVADTVRGLDAVRQFERRNASLRTAAKKTQYLRTDKDKRYRDSGRMHGWLSTLANNPPTPATPPCDPASLVACHGVELAQDPRTALANVNTAIETQQRSALPMLLEHAGRLIPDVSAAGAEAWLSYLHLSYHTAMESEHISGLRYARALQADAIRFAPTSVADHRVRMGLGGRGHFLQMFGHYNAAIACYTEVIRHAHHFFADTEEHEESLHNAYAQLAYTRALAGLDLGPAKKALARAEAIADRHGDNLEIQFTRSRRILEVRLAETVRIQELSLSGSPSRNAALVGNQLAEVLRITAMLDKPNRRLAAHDLLLLYAVATRDVGLALQARDGFQRTTDQIGGFANLTDRFNARLHSAAAFTPKFADIAPVTGPPDPLRTAIATPTRSTGLLL
ncbi:hypothetical protein ACWEQA_12775 [Nocardia sp. NPDC004085]